ncbi:hypothetical protein ACFWXJ_18260, partial [[Kitasatospora] papulosa]
MTDPSPAVATAVEGELRLLDPVVRASADVLVTLLHPDFREIGTSGRLSSSCTVSGETSKASVEHRR